MSKSIERLVVERAIKIVETQWTQGQWGEDAQGFMVPWHSKKAVRFCAEGAVRRATREAVGSGSRRLATRIIGGMGEGNWCLLVINDRAGRRAVLRVMRQRLREL